jgi:hypothetical protein
MLGNPAHEALRRRPWRTVAVLALVAALACVLAVPARARGVTPGVYLVRATVHSATPGRVELTVDGSPIACYATATTPKIVSAVVRLTTGDEVIGARSVALSDGRAAAPLDVEGMAITPTTAGDTVRGSTIVDPKGQELHYRGLNVPTFFSPGLSNGVFKIPDMPVADVWRWGADFVRVQLNQELWLADCAATELGKQTTYRNALLSDVSALTSRGLKVLLSLSVTQRGQATGCQPSSPPYLKEMADTRSIVFWTELAAAFKDKANVAFDLFNEPNNITDDVWRNGGPVTYAANIDGVKRSLVYQAAGMQSLYDAVRSTGATNLVYVAGTGWGTNTSVHLRAPLDGYGIVGSTHVYCNGCDADDPHLPTNLDTVNNTPEVLDHMPVVMTESGWNKSQDGTFNTAALSWADSHADGWVMHMFFTGPFSLLQSWSPTLDLGGGRMTKAPNALGAPVWNALADQRVARGYPALLQ